MQGRVEWTGANGLQCTNSNQQSLQLDWEDGPSPMQVTLQMVAACSVVDVITGLKDRSFSEVWVDIDSSRAEQSPRVFKTIQLTYHVKGDVPLKLVERIVEKSHEKYCSVSNMLTEVDISSTIVLHDV
ncbi:MAG: OsmC family protein [Candidatus Poseidoniaceae archaeon]|nr:OsmC family protein [Candidatus Poseidoniaceae archaeon]